jgi:DNA-binding transcriptional ArsR family regulator
VKEQNLEEEVTQLHADLCYALADKHRILIIYALSSGSKNVSQITQELEISQPSVSRHLKILKDRGCVKSTRQGTSMRYELTDPRLVEALDLLRAVMRDRWTHVADIIESTTATEQD